MNRDEDGRVIHCTPKEFGQLLEGYFGDYKTVQRDEVGRWAKHRSPRILALVYRYCLLNEETAYGKPPTIKRLNANLAEVFEAYPELRAERAGPLLLEDARPGTDLSALWEAMRKAFRRGENPAEAAEVKQLLKEHEL
jgi:hypothetical protein